MMENRKQQKALLEEMVDGLTDDLAKLTKLITERPEPAAPPDLQPFLKRVADAINGLRDRVDKLVEQKPPVAPVDSSQVLEEIRSIRQEIRKSPANRISKAVQYGAIFLVVSLLTTGILAYYATKWKNERDAFEVSDWKWRAVRQVDAKYVQEVDRGFSIDSISQQNKAWILEQEQADASREAARQALEQAKAMNAKADKLERKAQLKEEKSKR